MLNTNNFNLENIFSRNHSSTSTVKGMEKKIDLGEESKRNIHIRSLDYMTTKKLLNKLEVVSFIYIYIYMDYLFIMTPVILI